MYNWLYDSDAEVGVKGDVQDALHVLPAREGDAETRMSNDRPPAMDFADELGPGYINLVVRRLGQRIAGAGDAYMRQTGLKTSATSTAILAYVARHDLTPIADVAQALGYSHQAVAKAAEAMGKSGLMQSRATAEDLRKRLLSLTDKGRQEAEMVDAVAMRAAAVFGEVFDEIGVDVFNALRALETALDRRPLVGRLLEWTEDQEQRAPGHGTAPLG
jgi:DNA-binding MarR family transcriptional regulator